MSNRIFKILWLLVLVLITTYPETAASYNVSGVVDFSYRGYETSRDGKKITSNNFFVQHYELNLASPVWDPRFLRLNTGVGYTIIKSKYSDDSNLLTYDLRGSFFPGRAVSWDLFGRRTVSSVESSSSIAGYDVETLTYGGTINLRRGGAGSNNNNNNNNNNNRSSSSFSRYLPNAVVLSHFHTESESLDLINPVRQDRDDTRAQLTYRYNSVFDMSLEGDLEKFNDVTNNSSYETKSASFASHLALAANADLKLHGRMTDRSTENIAGFLGDSKESHYGAMLSIGGRGIAQTYTYDFSKQEYAPGTYTMQRAEAMLSHNVSNELMVRGGINYSSADLERFATATAPETHSTLDTGSLLLGVVYNKQYKPSFMGPFAFNTGYDFNTGFADYSSDTGDREGSGWYYENGLRLGVASVAWTNENVSLDYAIKSKRDDSPVGNDVRTQNWRLNAFTRRIPRTTITASAAYGVVDSSNTGMGAEFLPQTSTNQESRTASYNARADYSALPNWILSVGGSKGETISNIFTLSTLSAPSQVTQNDELLFAESDFSYVFTRNLMYRLKVRDEYRKVTGTETQDYQVNMYLNYRIRQVFLLTEYGWRQDNPEIGSSFEQQYVYVKLSRPF